MVATNKGFDTPAVEKEATPNATTRRGSFSDPLRA
jgi:hypothetical protein